MTKEEKAVVRAAVALCNAGRGFCFKDDSTISSTTIGKRLEYAVARLAKHRGKK